MSTDWHWCYENPGEAAQEIDRLRTVLDKACHALEMVRDANRDEPHIPPPALAYIEAALTSALGKSND